MITLGYMQLTFFLDDSDEERKESNKKISEIEKKNGFKYF